MIAKQLAGYQKAYLRRLAHKHHPLVMIGRQGYTEAVRLAIDQSLVAHELIKVKFQDCKDDRATILAACADELSAQVVGLVGHVGILYRPAPKTADQLIRLPKHHDN